MSLAALPVVVVVKVKQQPRIRPKTKLVKKGANHHTSYKEYDEIISYFLMKAMSKSVQILAGTNRQRKI